MSIVPKDKDVEMIFVRVHERVSLPILVYSTVAAIRNPSIKLKNKTNMRGHPKKNHTMNRPKAHIRLATKLTDTRTTNKSKGQSQDDHVHIM